MVENNELERRIREIITTKDPKLKYSQKVDLRAWAKDENTNITTSMIDELDREELGIYMKWGAGGDNYNYAHERNRKIKAGIPEKAEDQPTGKPPITQGKPSLDESKGFEQFTDPQIKALVHKSNDQDVCDIATLFAMEVTKRGLVEQPDVA